MANRDTELWQLYDEQGQPIIGKGASKADTFGQGILHGASHVWIWRRNNDTLEVLVQKRAAKKLTWPGLYDISAAGHIDLGETPIDTALREAKEEINLDIVRTELKLFGVHCAYLRPVSGVIENEFQWLYKLEIKSDMNFITQHSEVESLRWVTMYQFKVGCITDEYVPHGAPYYELVVSAIEYAAKEKVGLDQAKSH